MYKIFVLCLLAVSVYGAPKKHPEPHYGYGYAPAPVKVVKVQKVQKAEPYTFSYDIKDDYHNSQSRQESGDEHGNMEGSYTITLANGLTRVVNYWADENGFRAKIDTNEPGTDAQNPADVEMNAEPIEVKEEPKKVVKKILVAPSYGYGPRYH